MRAAVLPRNEEESRLGFSANSVEEAIILEKAVKSDLRRRMEDTRLCGRENLGKLMNKCVLSAPSDLRCRNSPNSI